jgi:ATP-binding cassette subfamily B protein
MGEVVQTSSGSMQRVTQILDEPVDVDDSPDAIELPRIEKEIKFEDIHFGYDPERPILTESWSVLSVDTLQLLEDVATQQAKRFAAEAERLDLEQFGPRDVS